MSKETRTKIIDGLKIIATGGLYVFVIFVKILFTTPEGQKIVEREIDKRIKAYSVEKEKEEDTPTTNKIGFNVED